MRLIAINPTLRAETERLLPVLEAMKAPAADEEMMQILIRHAPAYGVHAKNAAEWSMLFGTYLDALAGLPAYAIEDAFLRWNRGEGHADIRMAGFYPKAPQLVILAQAGKAELYTAAWRARRALEYVEKKLPHPISEDERKANSERLKALADTLAGGGRSVASAAPAPGLTRHQMAERIRAAATPGDVGDVI
jgi:hypothetical protein